MKGNQQKKDTTKKKLTTNPKSSNTSSKKTKKGEPVKNAKARSKIELYDLETNYADLEKTVKIDAIDENILSGKKMIKNDDNKGTSESNKSKTEAKEVILERKSGFNILEVIIIIVIALCIGGFIGGGLVYYYNRSVDGTTVPKKFDELVDTYDEILSNYYEEINSDELIDAAIKGMLNHLGDAHSVYIDKDATKKFNEELDGELIGIGAEIMRKEDGTIVVNYPFENGPSYDAGIKTGDVILKVDGNDISNLTVDELSSVIKGKSGTTVTITISRDGKEMDFSIVRTLVQIPSVVSAAFDRNGKKVGYLGIDVFARNTLDQFKEELKNLEKNNIDSLIIDVRDNNGGHLDIVRDIASLFLEKNKIVYKLDTKGIVEDVYSTSKESRGYPIAVLINSSSASASEILAAALLESYGADVIGVLSYGKGTVQTSHQLDSGATIKYTHQRWLTPNGNWIDGIGVNPTMVVELSEEYGKNPSDDTDNQLQAAINLLSKK